MNDKIQKLADTFKHFAEKSMQESEAAIGERNWVKAERKETEAETWMEAHRMLKKLLLAEAEAPVVKEAEAPQAKEFKYPPAPVAEHGPACWCPDCMGE